MEMSVEMKVLKDREEWLKHRTRIGGSDAACIVGMNPYRSNVELWQIKTGQAEAEDISHEPYVKYGTEAAVRAGYSKKTANRIGTENLSKPVIKDYIAKRMAEKEATLIANQDEVLKYLTSVMRGKSVSEEIVVEGTGDGCSEAKAVQKHPSEKDKLKAAELLGKRYGIYTDKIENNVDMELNISIDYGDENE